MIEKFKTELLKVGIRTSTINSYITDIEQFVKWFNLAYDKEFNNEILDENAKEYVYFLLNTKKYTINSVIKKFATVKRFNNFLITNGLSKELSFRSVNELNIKFVNNVDKYEQVKIISNEDLDKLINTINATGNKRDIAIFQILINTGIRVNELINIELDDVKLLVKNGFNDYKYLIVRNWKANKIRKIPLNSLTEMAINDYLNVRPQISDTKLFQGQRGSITRTTINRLLKSYCYDAGIELVSPYTFRHTFCSKLINEGIPVALISELMGHISAEMTLRYTMNISNKDIEKYRGLLDEKLLHK